MRAGAGAGGDGMIDWKDKAMAAVVSVAATTGLMWCLVATAELSTREAVLFGPFVYFLLWALLICVLKAQPKSDLVLAPLLERYVLNPLGNRLREKWLEKGRAQGRVEIRARLAEVRHRLAERGLNPDEFLPPQKSE